MSVPVIDLFAGPGGLGEGFSRSSVLRFEIAVSIEKDPMAYETLLLRAAHRSVARSGRAGRAVWGQWDRIIGDSPWEEVFNRLEKSGTDLFRDACAAAREEAWNLELGPDSQQAVSQGIRKRIRSYMRGEKLPDNAVLIGGPPCQAYSIVGRSRNRGNESYVAEDDARHFLYREYLQVIREFRPAVFVMENVKGILSSRVADRRIVHSIMSDLQRPDLACGNDAALHYALVALSPGDELLDEIDPQSFVLHAEKHGIPQARHRVVICGVRRDVLERAGGVHKLRYSMAPTVDEVIGGLPRVRPQLSFRGRGIEWRDSLDHPLMVQALEELEMAGAVGARVAQRMKSARREMKRQPDPGSGAQRLVLAGAEDSRTQVLGSWYRDRPLKILANHESRAHMPEDLVRYLFVAAYGAQTSRSPKLAEFPRSLLPKHSNINLENIGEAIFKDRFRVQLANVHSMTVTSHIGKDGHAFIHPDPSQCRSLTVREAARLQTFPDSYVFLGTRTSQYTQVGNAVPPLLARQIADVVGGVLVRSGLASRSTTGSEAASTLLDLSASKALMA
ncbi:DNA cytosine methyltransferase [Variovorax paradoxus]|nr:DNA (cytosine-5-)-methyltransferase [Variovorax paradoxus]MBT2305502.1 DNA cytosine methyltransferase [Variovorax paradoxus]